MGDKLELTWPGKHDGHAIVRDERTGAPRKVPYAEVQPRLLIESEHCDDQDSEDRLDLEAARAALAEGEAHGAVPREAGKAHSGR